MRSSWLPCNTIACYSCNTSPVRAFRILFGCEYIPTYVFSVTPPTSTSVCVRNMEDSSEHEDVDDGDEIIDLTNDSSEMSHEYDDKSSKENNSSDEDENESSKDNDMSDDENESRHEVDDSSIQYISSGEDDSSSDDERYMISMTTTAVMMMLMMVMMNHSMTTRT